MLIGKAKGGPRDGVKLTAEHAWDGLVRTGDGKFDTYYSGYYYWSVSQQTWVWNHSPRSIDWGSRHYGSKAL